MSLLVEELHKHFPQEQVFQDIASTDPGADFVEVLDKALATRTANERGCLAHGQ